MLWPMRKALRHTGQPGIVVGRVVTPQSGCMIRPARALWCYSRLQTLHILLHASHSVHPYTLVAFDGPFCINSAALRSSAPPGSNYELTYDIQHLSQHVGEDKEGF